MSAAPDPGRKTLQWALALASAGYPVFPCRPFSKAPATQHGLLDASVDPSQVTAWFDNDRGFNLAVRCGECPVAGVNLLAIDVDPKKGGVESWAALVAVHGVPLAPRHETPSGGFHMFFDTPEAWTSVEELGAGIDTRGVGGYVVVPPSQLVNGDGEIIRYATRREVALVENRPPASPGWLRPPPIVPAAAMARHPSAGGPHDGVFDRVRAAWRGWEVELVLDGWSVARRSGGEVYFTRPGKNPREGHSAVAGPNSGLRVFTETRPLGGKPMLRGPGVTYSPGEYVLEYRCGGDFAALGRMYPSVNGVRVASGGRPERAADETPSDQATQGVTGGLVVSDEFWSSSPLYEHIRQEAWSALMPPSLALGAVLTRYAATIPCCYRIPPIVGRVGSLNVAVCIVSSSGGGKTSMMDAAVTLVPSSLDEPGSDGRPGKTMFNQGMGSGEGMIEAFYEELASTNAKGQATSERVRWYDAVNYMIDEGGTVLAQLERAGTTEIDYFNSMWASATVSTRTAQKDRRRHLPGHSYRWTAALNIQALRGHAFLHEKLIATGFPQRLLFVWGDDPDLPDEDLDPLGALDLPSWPVLPETLIEFDDSIWAQVRSYRRQKSRGRIVEHPLDRHRWLAREKTAAILAFMHGEARVGERFWHHADLLHGASDAVRLHLIGLESKARSDRSHNAAEMAGALDAVRLESSKRKQVATYSQRLLRHVRGAGTEGIPLNLVRKKLTTDERWAWEPCKARLLEDAVVRIDGDRMVST